MKRILLVILIFLIIISCVLCYWPNRWNYIVIHHSAGNYGNIEFLQEIHKERQKRDPINAIAYHYIIGNGNGMEDGKIDSDIRIKYNLLGSHVSIKNFDYNFRGIGICVIGNLEKKEMTKQQYVSLLKLTKELMNKYNIKIENVNFHGQIKNELTLCPGSKFPYDRFLKDLE